MTNSKIHSDLNTSKTPMLVEELMQHPGLVAITGSSDVGGSCFLEQLLQSLAEKEIVIPIEQEDQKYGKF